jgi:hypothetical protein
MQNTVAIFFVTKEEYPKLQSACPNDFPFTYAQFVARVNEGIKNAPDGFSVIKVNISVDEFLAWCAQAKIEPNNIARSRYAALMSHRGSLN